MGETEATETEATEAGMEMVMEMATATETATEDKHLRWIGHNCFKNRCINFQCQRGSTMIFVQAHCCKYDHDEIDAQLKQQAAESNGIWHWYMLLDLHGLWVLLWKTLGHMLFLYTVPMFEMRSICHGLPVDLLKLTLPITNPLHE